MSNRDYFKRVSGLPDLRGELSRCLPSAGIASANAEVTRTLNAQLSGRKKPGGFTISTVILPIVLKVYNQ